MGVIRCGAKGFLCPLSHSWFNTLRSSLGRSRASKLWRHHYNSLHSCPSTAGGTMLCVHFCSISWHVMLQQNWRNASPSCVSGWYQTSSADGGGRALTPANCCEDHRESWAFKALLCTRGSELMFVCWHSPPLPSSLKNTTTQLLQRTLDCRLSGRPGSFLPGWTSFGVVQSAAAAAGAVTAQPGESNNKKKKPNTTQWTFHPQSGRSAPTAWNQTFLPSASYCTSWTVTVCSGTWAREKRKDTKTATPRRHGHRTSQPD